MFQRFKTAIDRTIEQEQARQKTLADQRKEGSVSRSSSSAGTNGSKEAAAKRRQGKKRGPDDSNGDNMANTDPAVFEAAFALDDDESDTRSSTPKPPVPEKDVKPVTEPTGQTNDDQEDKGDGTSEKPEAASGDASNSDPGSGTAAVIAPEIKTKLRKLEKLEKTYPELLRSYRIAHGRATSIEPFEKALRENTPLTSIKDPDALIEYLQQLNLKGDMVMDEFKRVSAEKDSFKRKAEESEQELVKLRDEIAGFKAASKPGEETKSTEATGEQSTADIKDEVVSKHVSTPSVTKSPVSSILGVFSPTQKPQSTQSQDASEDMFSYDDEIPQLQAELVTKAEEITSLKAKVSILKEELDVAKENSNGLVESLEKATRELSESRDKTSGQESVQTQLDERNTEIKSLAEKLDQTTAKLNEVESFLEEERETASAASKDYEFKMKTKITKNLELDGEIKRLGEEKAALQQKIVTLEDDAEAMKKQLDEAKSQAVNETADEESLKVPAATTGSSTASKKKNKKKKKGGASPAPEAPHSDTSEQPPASPLESPGTSELHEELGRLKQQIDEKDAQIEKLSKQRKTEQDLREEIESMQENLLAIGQSHVEAKEKIKALEAEKTTLRGRIAELEKQVADMTSAASNSSKAESDFDQLKTEYDELKLMSNTLTSDLGAAQKLAQDRYKDLTELRDVLSKAQPELKSLRQDSATLKTTKDELAAKQTDIRNVEKREKELKVEVTRVQRLASERESEIKSLNERIAAEAKTRAKLEDDKRVAGRDFRRAEADKVELSAKAEKMTAELEPLRSELESIKPKITSLESIVETLKREKGLLKEEADLKTAQYNSAQGLLGSMRDQSAELSTQLKESRSQAESLEEELGEVQKHLQERTREGETMRRMVSEVDERADQKVREMRSRYEAAVEERDRIEDESSTLARKRAREGEELRGKVRELEREVKTLGHEKEDLETREREWKRRREELEQIEANAVAEAEDMRSAVSDLQTALDGSEAQVRDAEKQRADLRKLLDESRAKYEKLAKDLKTAQSKLSGGSNVGSSSRSSMDSTRSGTNGTVAGGASGTPDTAYLKTILLQFLEVKDEKVRGQLVPVLGKLLKFDRSDEQKWMAAVQHLAKPGR